MHGYISELENIVAEIGQSNLDDLAGLAVPLEAALEDLKSATGFMLSCLEAGDKQTALCGATPYLKLFGLASGGVYLGLSALKSDEAHRPQRAHLTRFMAHNLCAETAPLKHAIEDGAASIGAAADMLLSA